MNYYTKADLLIHDLALELTRLSVEELNALWLKYSNTDFSKVIYSQLVASRGY